MRSLEHYAREWRKLGKREFRLMYGKPALLGVGIVADVAKGTARGPTGTLFMTELTEEPRPVTLAGRAWLITKGPDGPMGPAIVAGRSAYNDVVVADYTISNRHCQFRYEPGRILLSDLDSLNGTYVNGRRLSPTERVKLKPHDQIIIGRFLFVFVNANEFVQNVEQHAA